MEFFSHTEWNWWKTSETPEADNTSANHLITVLISIRLNFHTKFHLQAFKC